jgi:hypothetical protein
MSREAFEAMMRDTFGDAVSLHNDGVMYTDGFVGAVHIGWLKGSLAEAERFKRELEMQAAQAPQPVVPEGQHLVPTAFLTEYLELLEASNFNALEKLVRREGVKALLSAGKKTI